MSVVAHFFMSVGGSEIHERLAHFFIDFYKDEGRGLSYTPSLLLKPDLCLQLHATQA